MEISDFKFIEDKPLSVNDKDFYNFYHNSLAPALTEIINSDSVPHTIGLFGSWGAGKSTVIQLLNDDESLDVPIFVFDAWKYKDDSLRRTFLFELVDFLEEKKLKE